jgi:3-phosphoshikimate 1-carboxyvinyltransferase
MTAARVQPAERPVRGRAGVPGDKSISHRAALIASVADGESTIRGFSPAGDCASTLGVLSSLGVEVRRTADVVSIVGRAGDGFGAPPGSLDCGRSGTTMRLLAGLLAGYPGAFVLTGHDQLLRRPMERVAAPLREMDARVETTDGRPPIFVEGGAIAGIEYAMPVASAQVKSAVLLAGLRASGSTTVVEPAATRDHTERLLAATGVPVARSTEDGGARIQVRPAIPAAMNLRVPGDISSAAFLIAAAALVPGSDLLVQDVGLNPTRTGFLDLLERMGCPVVVERVDATLEPAGDLRIRHQPLEGVRVERHEVPGVIDELPLIGLLATQAEGVTQVHGAEELRVKESDRIAGLVSGLRALGADAEELPDGFVVRGPSRLTGGRCDARSDHRLAMTFTLAGLIAADSVTVEGMEFVGDSFPAFLRTLEGLR